MIVMHDPIPRRGPFQFCPDCGGLMGPLYDEDGNAMPVCPRAIILTSFRIPDPREDHGNDP
jgi:hypothetical protein